MVYNRLVVQLLNVLKLAYLLVASTTETCRGKYRNMTRLTVTFAATHPSLDCLI
jgi:hypothetical protein